MRGIPLLLSCTLLFLCTGCAAVQVRDRAYLQALELTDPEQPTVQLHDFETAGALAQGTGGNFEQAIENAAVPIGKELFLGHLELIAYSKPEFGSQLNQLMEKYRLSPSCKVLGLSEGSTLTDTDTAHLTEQLHRAEKSGLLPETDLFTILREFSSSAKTALLPVITENGFSAAVITETESYGTLSPEAVAGLCWLRGDNHPETLSLPNDESYTVHSAAVRLTGTMTDGKAEVTVSIRISGEGDFVKAAACIQNQCEAAIQETVVQSHADVFDWEACLQSQCFDEFTNTDWTDVVSQAEFQVKIYSA
ncbi:Ger(x)C family spore germination C-terminal domain-containing protein [Ruminococcus sp.]|uniref:Ger(x)C family spore germination C-terminal domain-containing protein n=1 Tax=Ruminococcus sp. TaxID=41978 RepID=UPI0025F3E9EB|nr:Ger(x)C family spore germination C-terminal domain-containing protein [Ruminococcus sp.]